VLLRRRALDEVGLFDEGFFIYVEEVDLCPRPPCRRKVFYFPDVIVIHHESKFSADVHERRMNEMCRARHRYRHKHHTPAAARLAALATGAQYFGAATGGFFRGPAYRSMRLHARNAWRVEGPGLRELADEWNVRRQSGDR
jgi:GT2 family glycosyltransferase